eukprot:COSAG02_NODE_1424_length_12684_cov_13.471116_8_plen_125_part_00
MKKHETPVSTTMICSQCPSDFNHVACLPGGWHSSGPGLQQLATYVTSFRMHCVVVRRAVATSTLAWKAPPCRTTMHTSKITQVRLLLMTSSGTLTKRQLRAQRQACAKAKSSTSHLVLHTWRHG